MPLPFVTENFSGRMLTKVSGAWVARRVWIATGTDSKSDAIDACVFHGASHPDNPNMRVASRSATAFKGPLSWTVTADYRFGDVGIGADNPCDEPTKILPDIEHESRAFEVDLDGNNVFNSAGDPYDPPDTRFIPVITFVARRFVPFYDLQVALAITDHVNSNPFYIAGFGGADVEQVYCYYYRPCEPYTSTAPYVLVEAKIGVKNGKKPWQPRRVDQGRWGWFQDDDTEDLQKGRICDIAGNCVDFDVRLNGKGKPIDPRWGIWGGKPPDVWEPVEGPDVPGLEVDPELSTDAVKILISNQIPTADFTQFL